jgi:uncharacterized protein YggT (Ycf19 family)
VTSDGHPRLGLRLSLPVRTSPKVRDDDSPISPGDSGGGPDNLQGARHLVWLARALTYLIYAFVIVALILLLLGFFLLLFGANPHVPFAEWVYRSLTRVMAPFRGLFEPVRLDGRSVVDVSILFAMIVYGLVALVLHAAIEWLTARLEDLYRY